MAEYLFLPKEKVKLNLYFIELKFAGVAELVDALDSGSSGR